MLQDIESKKTKATCKVYCKKCCRKEYHFLNVRGGFSRFILKMLTLGTIGFFGQYRCVCCGTSRIGRFDIIRGRTQKEASFNTRSWNPLQWWLSRRESWDGLQRRKRWRGMFSGSKRKKKYRHKPFRRKFW